MNRTRAAAELVLRYLTARALFRQTPWEMPPNLEYLIGRGVRLLPGGVLINEVLLARTPAIIDDRKDPLFWSAIIGGEQDVIEMTPEEQEQVRAVHPRRELDFACYGLGTSVTSSQTRCCRC